MVSTRSQRAESEQPKVGTKRRRPTATQTNTKKTVATPKKRPVKNTPTKTKATKSRKTTQTEVDDPPKRNAPRTKKAALDVLSKAEEKQKQKNEVIDQSMGDEPITPRLKNVSRELLNSVRRREMQNKMDIENCTKEKLHMKSLLCRIPDICNHLRSYYRSQKKTVMEMDLITKQLCEITSPAIQKSVMEEMMDLLLQIAPAWCSIITVNDKKYLKIKTSKPLGEVKQEITKQIDELGL